METHADQAATRRERELELEVARLSAELEMLRGEEPGQATTRLLEMAAATVDAVVADARREADEIIVEISAEAEARRDEATRVAAEAEAMADRKLAEADRAQEIVDQATADAEDIRKAAEAEADRIVTDERERMAGELAELDEARASIASERESLASYHQALQQRVQELAESMVTFMSADMPGVPALSASGVVVPLAEAVVTEPEAEFESEPEAEFDSEPEAEFETESEAEFETESEAVGDDEPAADDELVAEVAGWDADVEHEPDDEVTTGPETGELLVATSVVVEAVAVDVTSEDPWGDALAAATVGDHDDDPEVEAEEEPAPDLFARADETDPAGADDMTLHHEDVPHSHDEFGGVPVTEEDGDDDEAGAAVTDDAAASVDRFDKVTPSGSGLFARLWRGGSGTADDFGDLAPGDDTAAENGTGLFGMFGERLLEQTPPDTLAEALGHEHHDDDSAFEEFLSGDDEPDPSRDWLLRPESS